MSLKLGGAALMVACISGCVVEPLLTCVAGCSEAEALVHAGGLLLREGTAAAFRVTDDGDPFEEPRSILLHSDDPTTLGVAPTSDFDTFVFFAVKSGAVDLRLEVAGGTWDFAGLVLPR